jgi:hypothetical protein
METFTQNIYYSYNRYCHLENNVCAKTPTFIWHQHHGTIKRTIWHPRISTICAANTRQGDLLLALPSC